MSVETWKSKIGYTARTSWGGFPVWLLSSHGVVVRESIDRLHICLVNCCGTVVGASVDGINTRPASHPKSGTESRTTHSNDVKYSETTQPISIYRVRCNR